jgi:hypothetical protein
MLKVTLSRKEMPSRKPIEMVAKMDTGPVNVGNSPSKELIWA